MPAPWLPLTPWLDGFDRADGAIGAAWTAMMSSLEPLPSITGQKILGLAGTRSGYWNGATWADGEVWAPITGGTEMDLWLRAAGFSASLLPTSGYVLNSNGTNLTLYEADGAGGVTQLVNVTGLPSIQGMLFRGVGSRLDGCFWNGSRWVHVVQIVDATFTAAGNACFEIGGTSAVMDYIGGGPLTSTPLEGPLDSSRYPRPKLRSSLKLRSS